MLVVFGSLLICSGLYYRTPIPVQPMKAIGTAAIAQSALITPGMVWGAGIFTGVFWLVMGLTGALDLIAKIISKPVTKGIVLGLGLSFMITGTKMMSADFLVAAIALAIVFLLRSLGADKRVPVMFLLIILGLTAALLRNPELFKELSAIRFDFQVPRWTLGQITWSDLVKGTLFLGLPQIPLTLGNAVIAVTAENNRLFPERPVTEKKVAIFQGFLNLVSPLWGGVPVCHGAGGLAGHVRFGARTGGSLIILGVILLITGLCFSSSILLIFELFPASILGVILFLAGLELAAPAREAGKEKSYYFILLITAGLALWHIGAAFAAGVIAQETVKILSKILKKKQISQKK